MKAINQLESYARAHKISPPTFGLFSLLEMSQTEKYFWLRIERFIEAHHGDTSGTYQLALETAFKNADETTIQTLLTEIQGEHSIAEVQQLLNEEK